MDIKTDTQNIFRANTLEELAGNVPDNDSPAMWQTLRDRLWKFTTHPVANSTVTFIFSCVIGRSGTSLVLPNVLDSIDECDASNLGSLSYHLSWIVPFAVLILVNSGIGFISARQRFENLVEAKKDASEALTFGTEEPTTYGDEPMGILPDEVVQERCSISPPAAVAISLGMIFAGLVVGTFFELLIAPTQLGGSGCDLTPIKVGSTWMGVATALVVLGSCGSGYFIYKNCRNVNEVISETKSLRDTRYFTDHEQENSG